MRTIRNIMMFCPLAGAMTFVSCNVNDGIQDNPPKRYHLPQVSDV